MCALSIALGACDPPSASVDAGDLMGVFDKDAGLGASAVASSSSSARTKRSADVPPPVVARNASDLGCTAVAGSAAELGHTVGRPACRGAEVLEWRDPAGTPRYGCVYSPPNMEKIEPLPVVVFFHGTGPGLDDPAAVSKLTSLRDKQNSFDLTRDPAHPGFVILALQGRSVARDKWGTAFDTAHVSADNLDKLATDHFLDELTSRGWVDAKRVYAVGMGKGGTMAITYAMLRADRVAAFGAFAPWVPEAKWTCPGPPPPGFVSYRACDGVVACDAVEEWIGARGAAETRTLRLGDDATTEPNCTVKNKCTPKKAEANHHRWPKGRDKELLLFLSGHRLE